MTKIKEIKELEGELLRHKNLYYQGKAEISDYEYDQLEEKLKLLDPHNPVLTFVGTNFFKSEKVEHNSKMLSLNKTYKLEELTKWMDARELISTFKIDGSSCSLIYEKGRLVLAKTRGDGKFGEKITSKVLHIEHVPKVIAEYEKDFEVRGEIFCREEDFIHLSQQMEKLNLEKPTSQRNIVAGLLGRKENIELARFLSFQAFEFISKEEQLKTEEEKFKLLRNLGFETPEFNKAKSNKELEIQINEAREFMSQGDYLIDGLVFSLNDLELHDRLGETAHHPRYKIAFKFEGEMKPTVIKDISWQVSRNGILTPVANVEKVELSGAQVSRVTLHNFGLVRQFELKKGDKINIIRSGEVIPKFIDVVESSKNEFSYPEVCPSCSEKTYVEDIRLVCKNPTCPEKVKDEILNFIRKMGIENLSDKRLEELINAKVIQDIPSLYDLNVEKLMQMDKVKEKLASKIVNSIEDSKQVELTTLLASLGISGGAFNKCEKIVHNGFDTWEKIKSLTPEKLIEIESFAEKSSMEFARSLQSKIPLVESLLEKGIEVKKSSVKTDTKIAGKKFCITGSLSMKRADLQKIIKENGAVAVSSVTSATDYLITNDVESSSSKFKKAKQLAIPILSETAFLKMLE
ncbi:MAG: NAD-dependent DNA ligase LigA [Bacteriovoracaceae bacterium]|nr:NAD-dependent DNA ligase LigA [Bacteriovoracaceae bacterium]